MPGYTLKLIAESAYECAMPVEASFALMRRFK